MTMIDGKELKKRITSSDLSDDQQIAYGKLLGWFESLRDYKRQQMSLGGYAGTGKTTLIKVLIDELAGDHDTFTQVMALTGKAVSVLRSKGVPASTIHSQIYHVHTEKKKPVFTLRARLEDEPDLIIIDEASMVSTQLYEDLLSFAVPILWVGDHGQLEPVGKNPNIMKNPEIRLEQIHRQAAENPIIGFADSIRKGAQPAAIASSEHKGVIDVTGKNQIGQHTLVEADQVIVATNQKRVSVNKLFRHAHDYPKDIPAVGDRLICLKNDRRQGIFNGLQGKLVEIEKKQDLYYATIQLEDGRVWSGTMFPEQFNRTKGLCDVPAGKWQTTHWDYAYAVTCHKAQGSEWPHVVVLEQFVPRLWEMPRWRYTAVTRASERLTYGC